MRTRIAVAIRAMAVVLGISCSEQGSDRTTPTAPPQSAAFAKGGNPNKVKSISVSPSNATRELRQTVQLTATANPPSSATTFATVGTGGADHYSFGTIKANSERRSGTATGVLKLHPRDGAYDWEFVSAAGSSFTDSGSGVCHW